MKKRRFTSILLSAAIVLSSNSIYAKEILSYDQDQIAYPTEAPLAEPGTEPESLSINDETEYVTPEKTSDSLINDRAETVFSEDSLHEENADYDYYYSRYAQIVTGNENAVDELNSYYSENISAENETIYEILGKYFEEEDIKQIEAVHSDTDNTVMYKLYACFRESDYPTEEEKSAVSSMMIAGSTILESMNALVHYKNKLDVGAVAADNVEEAMRVNLHEAVNDIDSFEEANEAAVNSISTYASSDIKQDIYNAEIAAPKFYTPQSNNITIDTKSGNLRYTRRDVEIPLESGYMTLDLVYSVDDAVAAAYYYEEWIDDGDILRESISQAPTYVESPLGVGWRFNLTRRDNDVIYLRDGRCIYKDGPEYKDVVVDTLKNGERQITYVDGSTEFLDKHGLLYKSIDRYGNITEYEYKDVKGFYSLSSMTSQEKTVTIDYSDDYTTITKPDGDKVKYKKSDFSVTYGSLEKRTWNRTVKTLSEVILCSGRQELCNCVFYYYKQEINIFRGYLNHIYCLDYKAFAVPFEIEGSDGNCYAYEYTSGVLNEKNDRYTYNVKVSKKQIYEYAKTGTEVYSNLTYKYNKGNTNHALVTEKFTNNKTIVYDFCDVNNKTDIYETKDGTEYLKSSDTLYYEKNCDHIPTSKESVIYNINGNSITTKNEYTYNDQDQIITDKRYIENSPDNEIIYTYTNGFLTKEVFKRNNKILYTNNIERGSHGEVIEEYISNSYRDIEYEYDDSFRMVSKKIKTDSDTGYEYEEYYEYSNGMCLPSSVMNKSGNIVLSKKEYTYDLDSGAVLTATDGNGNTTTYQYDARGNIEDESKPDGSNTHIYYNEESTNGHPNYYCLQYLTVTHNRSYEEYLSFWHTGELAKQYIYEYGQEPKLVRTIDYDAYGNMLSDTDANGNTVTIENDIFGRQTSVQYEQDENAIRIYYYDVFFDGNDKCSAVIKIDQTNKASIQYYDLYGQNYKNAIIKNMSSLSEVDWDNITQLPSNTQLIITQTNEFDELGRVIKTCDGENRPVTYEYDAVGNITKQVTGNADDTPLEVKYTYDSIGNVLTMDQAGHVTMNEYDKAGRLVKTTDPMGFVETYQYDKNSNLIKSVDKNGDVCSNTYDSMNRLIKTTKNGESKEYEYEKTHGNIISQTDSSGTISYTYNTNGTLATKTYPDGKTISYTEYDMNKNLLSMTDYFGNITDYEYDGKNQIISVGEKYKGASEYITTTYQYNENGSLAQVNMPKNMTTYYNYDYAGRISYLNNTSIYLDTYARFNYTYDNSGNITAVTQNIHNQTSTKTYAYDSANRLSYERGAGSYYGYYSYDEHNNLRAIAGSERDEYYTYDANNRLTDLRVEGIYTDPETGDEYTDWRMFYDYDNNGSLLSATYYLDPDNCPTKTYQYNAWGQLTGFSNGYGNRSTYTYWADGLRQSRKVGSNTFKYYYNGGNVINETKNNSEHATNVMGVDGILSRKNGSLNGYYWKDAHGNVVYIFGGYRYSDYDYNAWGDGLRRYDWHKDFNPMLYCGEYYDDESGLQYLRGRYYSPEIRRFITEDPAKDGLNWYAYCGNNPVMFVDPTGYITDEEIQMYEKGEMSPGAYSYLMKLTYNYYLADTDEDKAYYAGLADDFRTNGYESTPFENWNTIIDGMSSRPTGEITQEEHYFRNKLNIQFEWDEFQKLNNALPENLKWRELPFAESALHKFGQGNNKKYVSGCEHFEAVYTKEHYLVDAEFSSINMGTYNYYGPSQPNEHTKYDVIPWLDWGNTEKNYTWIGEY